MAKNTTKKKTKAENDMEMQILEMNRRNEAEREINIRIQAMHFVMDAAKGKDGVYTEEFNLLKSENRTNFLNAVDSVTDYLLTGLIGMPEAPVESGPTV